MSTELTLHSGHQITAFSSAESFESAQRMAKALCSSNIVPESFRGIDNIGNAIVALEMAQRIGASPLAVMQNLHIIHGRPSWSSTFIIAAINSCGRFSPLRFDVTGEGDNRQCIAWATDRTGERLEGPPSSIAMAKKEGWYSKNGSKWVTMPELMLRYRAAAFFGRLYAPDVLNGMHTADEVEDVIEIEPARNVTRPAIAGPRTSDVLDQPASEPAQPAQTAPPAQPARQPARQAAQPVAQPVAEAKPAPTPETPETEPRTRRRAPNVERSAPPQQQEPEQPAPTETPTKGGNDNDLF